MPQFYDTQTGRVVDGRTITGSLRRRRRYQEVRVPDGTVDEVVEWVGDDPQRRQMAVAAERAGQRRKGIIERFS